MLFVHTTTYLIMHACANIRQEAWRLLAKLADIRQAMLRRLARLADIRQAVLRGLAKLGTFTKPFCEYSPDSPNAVFEKNVTHLAKFARVIRETRADFASSHCLLF
jgi:hypothetical protein